MGQFTQKSTWADTVDSSSTYFVARHQFKGKPLLRFEGNTQTFHIVGIYRVADEMSYH